MKLASHATKSASATFWVAALLVSACGSSASDPPVPLPNEIVVGDGLNFTPEHLTVTAGTKVHFRNAGPYDHTLTSGASSKPADAPGVIFDTEFPSGGTFDFTFDQVGDHPYFCRQHEAMGMKGLVTVTAPGSADAGPGGNGGNPDAGGGGGYPYPY